MLKQDSVIQTALVQMAWRFGQSYTGGPIAGQLIMHTLANRCRLGWGTWLQVLEGVPRFMAENEIPELKYPSLWEPAFVKLLHCVEGVYDGSTPDLSHGSLYWCDLNRIERPWFAEKIMHARHQDPNGEGIIPVHQRVVEMGSLCFWA